MYKQVEIFTDGSCLGNPGPGGCSAILCYHQHEKCFSKGYHLTTNNRMELMAVIIAIEALKNSCNIVLTTDSQYVRNGITKWCYSWEKYDWKTSKKKLVKNIDLWQQLLMLLKQHKIQWQWVKGHNGHQKNERCDGLAYIASLNPTQEDIGYISKNNLELL